MAPKEGLASYGAATASPPACSSFRREKYVMDIFPSGSVIENDCKRLSIIVIEDETKRAPDKTAYLNVCSRLARPAFYFQVQEPL